MSKFWGPLLGLVILSGCAYPQPVVVDAEGHLPVYTMIVNDSKFTNHREYGVVMSDELATYIQSAGGLTDCNLCHKPAIVKLRRTGHATNQENKFFWKAETKIEVTPEQETK